MITANENPNTARKGVYSKVVEMVGRRFGRTVVLSRAGVSRAGRATWLCRCDCGSERIIEGSTLRFCKELSCGCKSRENSFRHGRHKTPEYAIWTAMKNRCLNPNITGYENYGGRGITVCERWKNSFMAFLEDIGERPSPELTLERINNDGNYEPGNCKWATRSEQRLNQRRSRNSVKTKT